MWPRTRLSSAATAASASATGSPASAARSSMASSSSATAPGLAAPRDILLPAEGEATVAAVAGLHQYSDLIYKHRKAAGVRSCRRPVRTKEELYEGACLDADELAHPAAILELHHARHLGE